MSSGLSKGLMEGLDQSEKMFQAKMRRIYEKYNHAFEDDIVVNIIDFTYSAPDGPIPWDFETKATRARQHERPQTPEREQNNTSIQTFAIEDSSNDSLEDDFIATCLMPKETSDSIFSRTFIIGEKSEKKDLSRVEHKELSCTSENMSLCFKHSAETDETCSPDGQAHSLMQYTGSNIGNKTFFVSPLETSVLAQVKSFIRRPNKDYSFEDTKEFSHNNYQADESRHQHCKENAYSDSGDTSLAQYYPDMVECIRRLWELPWKKRAADNIVQYYKRHVWNTHKRLLSTKQILHRPTNSRSMHMHPLRAFETFKGCSRYKNTLCPSKHFKKSIILDSVIHSPGNRTFIVNSIKDSTSRTSDNYFTKPSKVVTCEIDHCMEEKNRQLSVMKCNPVRRNICSMFPLMHNPKAKSKIARSTVDDRTIVLDKTFTYLDQTQTNDANSSYYHSGQCSEMSSMPLESSFSAFPVLQSPRKNTFSLSSSMDRKTTFSCQSFVKPNEVESPKTKSVHSKEPNRQDSMYKKRLETCDVNSSFQEPPKWLSPLTGTPPRTPGKHSVVLKCKIDPRDLCLDNTFTCQKSVEMNEVQSFHIREQDKQPSGSYALIRRNSFSALPSIHSPKSNTKSFFSINNPTTYQDNMGVFHHQGLTRQCLKLRGPLVRRNSFSNLPEVYSLVREKNMSEVMCEGIYKMENLNGPHANTQVQSSEMVWSLVNSPGSRRAKRQASSNLSFSTFKRQKSADETFIQSISNTTHFSMDNSLWQETTDLLPKRSPKCSGWS